MIRRAELQLVQSCQVNLVRTLKETNKHIHLFLFCVFSFCEIFLVRLIGIRCADVGLPQLSMHSIRETAHVDDVLHGINFLSAFFRDFADLYKRVKID
jgi:putative aminopeptidase FrvX